VGIGYAGDLGGTWTLTRLVGTAKARELYLLGDMFDSAEAERWGVVSKVVEDDRLVTETMAMTQRFATGPRVAYGYIKRNLHAAETEPLAAVLEVEAVHQIRASMTADHKEATRAFVEKRKPVFHGR
jgi:2-(1,2-epoxy-1,2-dihydrophenyl)acetyl-CoA isomerase